MYYLLTETATCSDRTCIAARLMGAQKVGVVQRVTPHTYARAAGTHIRQQLRLCLALLCNATLPVYSYSPAASQQCAC